MYATAGSYTVVLTVVDDEGSAVTDSAQIDVGGGSPPSGTTFTAVADAQVRSSNPTANFGSDPARADSLVRAIFAQIDTLQLKGPPASDIAKVKETLIRGRETSLRQNGWWLGQLLASVRDGDTPVAPVDPILAAITVESLRAAAKAYLNRASYVRVTLLPENKLP